MWRHEHHAKSPQITFLRIEFESQNGNMRKNFAAIGYTYDESRDAFISPQPYPSWILDEDTCIWKAPIEVPSDDKHYFWDESSKSWNEFKYT